MIDLYCVFKCKMEGSLPLMTDLCNNTCHVFTMINVDLKMEIKVSLHNHSYQITKYTQSNSNVKLLLLLLLSDITAMNYNNV